MNQGPGVAGAYPHQIFRCVVFMEKMRNKKLDVQELRNRLQKELPRLRQEYAVRSLGLFGSYVRGEHRKGSDLDVLVEFFQVPGMLRFLDIE